MPTIEVAIGKRAVPCSLPIVLTHQLAGFVTVTVIGAESPVLAKAGMNARSLFGAREGFPRSTSHLRLDSDPVLEYTCSSTFDN